MKPNKKKKAPITDGVVSATEAIEKILPKKVEENQVSALKEKLQKPAKVADEANTEKAIQKIQYNRELLWIYPADCITTVQRKVFRQKSRNQIRRWESQALKLEGKAKEAKLAEIREFREKVMADPNRAL